MSATGISDTGTMVAEETLLDQRLVRVDAKTYAQFIAILDGPPSSPGYDRLISAPRPWSE